MSIFERAVLIYNNYVYKQNEKLRKNLSKLDYNKLIKKIDNQILKDTKNGKYSICIQEKIPEFPSSIIDHYQALGFDVSSFPASLDPMYVIYQEGSACLFIKIPSKYRE